MTNHRIAVCAVAALLAALPLGTGGPATAPAQSPSETPESGQARAPALYEIPGGSEAELVINVHIWGQVFRPGRYLVPDGTDLVGLISYAGGPTTGAKLQDVQLLRAQSAQGDVRRIDLKHFLKSGDPSLIPNLEPGDIVVVPTSRSHTLLSLTGVVSVLALVANVVITASR
jgi:hypothetical protein